MLTTIIIGLLLILCGALGYYLLKQRQQSYAQEELAEELLNIPQDMVNIMDAANKLLDVMQLTPSDYINEMGVLEDILIELRSWDIVKINQYMSNKVESKLIQYRVTLEEIDEALTIMAGKVGD